MDFVKTRSLTDYIISAALIVAGIVLVAIPSSVSINILGSLIALTGIILILVMKNGYRNSNSKEMFSKKTFYFPASSKAVILDQLKNAPDKIDMSKESCGNNGLMLEVFSNRKCPKVFVKAYEYIPYKYEPCSDFFEIDKAQAVNFK